MGAEDHVSRRGIGDIFDFAATSKVFWPGKRSAALSQFESHPFFYPRFPPKTLDFFNTPEIRGSLTTPARTRYHAHCADRESIACFPARHFLEIATMVKQQEKKEGADLAAALKQAKSSKMHFVLILKGTADGALLVAKSKIGATEIAAAKAKSGGTKVVAGVCQVEDEHLVFETDEDPGAQWEKAVKDIAKRDAGLAIQPQFRQVVAPTGGSGNGNAVAQQPPTGGSVKGETPPATPTKPTAPPQQQPPQQHPPQQHPQQADYQQALRAIEGPLMQMLKENRGDTAKMRAIFSLAREKAEHGAFDVRCKPLGSLRHLIEAGAQAAAEPATNEAPGAKLKDRAAAFDGWIKQVNSHLNELKAMRAAHEKDLVTFNLWQKSSSKELTALHAIITKQLQSTDQSTLDASTLATIEFLQNMSDASRGSGQDGRGHRKTGPSETRDPSNAAPSSRERQRRGRGRRRGSARGPYTSQSSRIGCQSREDIAISFRCNCRGTGIEKGA